VLNNDVTRSLRRADLQFEQRRIVLGAALALIVTIFVLAVGYGFVAMPPHGTMDLADRVVFALRVDIVPLLWLLAAIVNVGNRRFLSRDDIQGAGFYPPSERLAIPVAILQNTLEQSVLAIGAYVILATLLIGEELIILPLLALLFCVGRLVFWAGYGSGAGQRAFGFVLTFFPTVAAYALALLLLAHRG
jgi:MAPEG family protein